MKSLLPFILPILLTAPLSAAEKEVRLERDFGTLFGTLLIPESGSRTAALLIAGSGPTDRNCNSAQGLYTDSFVYLAHVLEKEGIASLRYDKRGIGASRYDDPEKMYDISFDDYIGDAAAWSAWLRSEGFDKIVLIGHSEGALVALCAAAGNETAEAGDRKTETVPNGRVDGVVSLAGAGYPLDLVLLGQLSSQFDTGMILRITEIFSSLRQGKIVEDYPRELSMLFQPYLQHYWISQLKYDPREMIGRVRVPVLIVNGTNDLQVPVSNADALRKAQPNAALLLIEGMTHPLKQSESRDAEGQIAVYMDASLPIDPTLAESVPQFILSL